MKNCQIKKLQDRQLNEIVGGDAKLIATTTSAAVTCTAGVLSVGFLIGAMVTDDRAREARLFKISTACGALAAAGLLSTCALSKISGLNTQDAMTVSVAN